MMESKTPRTDAAEFTATAAKIKVVSGAFARSLELECAELRKVSKAVVKWYENAGNADPAPGSVELWSIARAALKDSHD